MSTYQKRKIKLKIISLIAVVAYIAVWYLCTAVLELAPSYKVPDPLTVVRTFITKLYDPRPDGSTLIVHFWSSFKVVMVGFCCGAVLGIPLGILMGWYRWVNSLLRPIFDFIRPIPPIALIPIVVILFGISLEAKAIIVFIAALMPCILNSYQGIKQTNMVHVWVAQTFGATNRQRLFTVGIPSAMPMIFTGLRVSMATSWMSLVAAELMGATSGLGYLISVARGLLRSDIIIVGMLCLGVIGICISLLFDFLEKLMVRGGMWQ